MFQLIQDLDNNSYLLLEIVRANTAYVYRTADTKKCWLPLSALSTTLRRDESPVSFRSCNTSCNFIYAHRTKAGILEFIDAHPELLI